MYKTVKHKHTYGTEHDRITNDYRQSMIPQNHTIDGPSIELAISGLTNQVRGIKTPTGFLVITEHRTPGTAPPPHNHQHRGKGRETITAMGGANTVHRDSGSEESAPVGPCVAPSLRRSQDKNNPRPPNRHSPCCHAQRSHPTPPSRPPSQHLAPTRGRNATRHDCVVAQGAPGD